MIFYFSATGNTKWIAETIAAALGDQTADIRNTDPESCVFGDDEMVGICFPVYACQAPPNVQRFASKLKPNGAFTYAVCNYSNFAGHALEHFSSEVLHINSGYGLLMPDDTSVMGYTFDDEESTREKLKTAPERLEKIIDRIKKRESDVFDADEGPDPDAYDTLADTFYPAAVTEPFFVDNDLCIGCGLCAKNCPVSAIEMRDDRPVWVKDHCYYCSGCINNCPKEAIGFGDKSEGVYRYTWKKYNS
jgi:NAD-dependent dihydropyrimidine dehydrogenase PreA subunit/flavodoxin